MDKTIIAVRRARAQEEAAALAHSIATKTGADASGLDVRAKDPALEALYRDEALVGFLRDLDESLEGATYAEEPLSSLADLDGVGPDLAEKLVDAGYPTRDSVAAASDKDLLAIDGLGKTLLKKIREQVRA